MDEIKILLRSLEIYFYFFLLILKINYIIKYSIKYNQIRNN
jgi:hypothetical protein